MSERDLAIAGGGIGGLTAALCCAARGLAATVYEREPVPAEAGAGIQLGPNATRVIADMGLIDRIAARAVEPRAIVVRDGTTGARLAHIALVETVRRRHNAPYLVIHRGDLHRVLHEAAQASPLVHIEHGTAVRGFVSSATEVDLELAEGRHAASSALVGADGLWSTVRRRLLGAAPARFTGEVAWRSLLPVEAAPLDGAGEEIGLWLAPGGHVVHYPVQSGATVNVVAIAAGEKTPQGWSTAAERETVAQAFAHWTPACRRLIETATEWRAWSLHERPPDQHWSRGRVTLLGDAAHPMRPYLAQGGAMALEDAYVLARCLARTPGDPARAFASYESLRLPRTARVQEASRANATYFHAGGLARVARNAALIAGQRLAPGRLLSRYDWLYGLDVTA